MANRFLVERAHTSLLGATRAGHHVDIYSPDGGKLDADSWSDPRDESSYSAMDLISLCFICSPEHSKLVENSTPISQLNSDEYDALVFVGGQGPMYTFYKYTRVHVLGEFVLQDWQDHRGSLSCHLHPAEGKAGRQAPCGR